jgi:hypothetical protein
MGMPGAFDQTEFALYEDGTESGATIVGSIGNQQSLEVDTTYQCRVQMDETSNTADDFEVPYFQYEVDQSGTWTSVGTGTDVIRAVTPSTPANGDNTTNRFSTTVITPNSWVTTDGNVPTLTYQGNDSCQALLIFQIVGSTVSNGQEIRIRLNGTPGPIWTKEADIDVVKAFTGRRRSNTT